MSVSVRVAVNACLAIGLLVFGLTVDPVAGGSASIPVTAELVRPIGVTVVAYDRGEPESVQPGARHEPSERHLELLLYPGRSTESQIQFNSAPSVWTLTVGRSAAESVVDTTLTADSVSIITIVPLGQ